MLAGLVVAATAIWISGCGTDSAETEPAAAVDESAEATKDGDEITVKTDEGKAKITTDGENGAVQYEATDADGGTVKVETGAKSLPADFPKEIPLPDDATIVTTVNMTSDQVKGYMVAITTGLDAQKAADFYRKALNDEGYQLSDTSNADGVTLVGENDTYNMLIIVMPDAVNAGLTSVTITFGSKE
ncbi:hypothetical protein [Cohnella sp. GCM10027633]|uniref:hypothetical protein n=1 Tax=unclassified Cohnella TaxID=2636738 RepID=UPI0036398CF6